MKFCTRDWLIPSRIWQKVTDSRTTWIYKADFGHIEVKFVGLQRGMGFEEIFSHGIMTSLSFPKFTDSLITQNFTRCQMVDFWYNMDIYEKRNPSKNEIWWLIVKVLCHHYTTNFVKFIHSHTTKPIHKINVWKMNHVFILTVSTLWQNIL